MKALVHRIAALLQGEQTDVRVFDGEQFQDAVTHGVVLITEKFPVQSFMPDSSICRVLHVSLTPTTYPPNRHRRTAIGRLRTLPRLKQKTRPRFQFRRADQSAPMRSGTALQPGRWGQDALGPTRSSASQSNPGECNSPGSPERASRRIDCGG